ncbi:MAG: DUF6263 family protein [Ferruginibacter sp.]
MKTGLLFIASLISLGSFAQKATKKADATSTLKLELGQAIKVTTESDMDMEMSMGMNMKNKTTAYNTFKVTAVTDDTYTLTSTLDRMVMSADAMGQDMKYDSDKKEDRESETGKAIGTKIGTPFTATIDRKTGSVKVDKKDIEEKDTENNPMASMMSAGQNETENIKSFFFVLPAGMKTGSTWQDSTMVDKMKTNTIYTLKSIDGNQATVGYTTLLSGTNQMEAQGMSFDVNMKSTTIGDIIYDVKTSLVKSRSAKADVSGTIDMGGQSMDITATATSTTDFK